MIKRGKKRRERGHRRRRMTDFEAEKGSNRKREVMFEVEGRKENHQRDRNQEQQLDKHSILI